MSTQAEKISDIQALRGLAILFVLCCHLSLPTALLNLTGLPIHTPFYLGVELFFVISGYVVTLSLIRSNFNITKFIVQRVFRLYPAILFFLVFSGIVNLVMRHFLKNDWLLNLFTIEWKPFFKYALGILSGTLNQLGGNAGYANGAMWSLSVEMQFYFFLAVICIISFRVLQQNSKTVLRAFGVSLFLFYFVILYYRFTLSIPALKTNYTPLIINEMIGWNFDFLIAGVLLALSEYFSPFQRVISKKMLAILFYGCLVLPLIVCAYCESPLAASTPHLRSFGYPIASLSFVIVVALAATNRGFGYLGMRSYQFLLGIGERSYTIYLLHFPLFSVSWCFLKVLLPRVLDTVVLYGISQMIVFTVIAIPVVEFVYRYIELPGIARGKALLKKYQKTRERNSNPEFALLAKAEQH
jgi:peptidoglycan/LPS O-acetylase OafA/YrhL